jgi:glutamine synthetase
MSGDFIDLTWIDVLGRPRAIRAATAELASVVEQLPVPLDEVLRGAAGVAWLRPDSGAVFPSPWEGGVEIQLCDLADDDGNPSPYCTRSVLKRALRRLAEERLDAVVAAEMEFYLYDPASERPVYDEIQNYGIVKGAEYEHVLRDVRGLRAFGIPVVASNPEYAGGQFEVNLHHGEPLAGCDAAALLRSHVVEVAARHGYGATFMARPWSDQSGSGMHFHQSLWHDGRNLFWDGGLSGAGRGYLAGLLRAMPELTPLGSPTANAYRRRHDLSFAPTVACWGGDNRTVAIRVLDETEASTRVEQRDAAADCNPYLALAGQLSAGLAGRGERLEPPPPRSGNAHEQPDLPQLARSLEAALPPFVASDLARDVLGPELHDALVGACHAEIEQAQTEVAEWERRAHLRTS